MSKKIFRVISKLFLGLIIFGFFQPVACDQNGFELAEDLYDTNMNLVSIGLYVTFFTAVFSMFCTFFVLLIRKNICSLGITILDYICVFASIAGGVLAFITLFDGYSMDSILDFLQIGSFLILAGWILSFIFLIFSRRE